MKLTRSLIPSRDLSIILLAMFVFVVGCSNPLNYEVAKLTDNQRRLMQQILTADQSKKIDDWIDRNATASKGVPSGVTVEQALDDQTAWLAKQAQKAANAAELRRQMQAKHAARQDELARMLSVTLVSKKNKVREDGQRFVAFEIAYANKTDRDIREVKSSLKLSNIYGDAIIDLNWSYDGTISVNQTVVDRDAGVDINTSSDAQVELWDTDFEKLKSTFQIKTIIFKDRTSVDDST
jgi:hypothetical protein